MPRIGSDWPDMPRCRQGLPWDQEHSEEVRSTRTSCVIQSIGGRLAFWRSNSTVSGVDTQDSLARTAAVSSAAGDDSDSQASQKSARCGPKRRRRSASLTVGVVTVGASLLLRYVAWCGGASMDAAAQMVFTNLSQEDGNEVAPNGSSAKSAEAIELEQSVAATAAESLLMGIFVIVCSFELRGFKAYQGSKLPISARLLSARRPQDLRRGASGPLDQLSCRTTADISAPGGTRIRQTSGSSTPLQQRPRPVTNDEDDDCSVYGVDDNQELGAHASAMAWGRKVSIGEVQSGKESWETGPLVMMMILLHVIYPSFPVSPSVELGRIVTFIGFLWAVGVQRCIAVLNTEPMHKCRLLFLTAVCTVVHFLVYIFTDTISDLIFPEAGALFQGPRYLHQLLMYLAIRYPVRSGADAIGMWAAWCVVSAVVFASAVWKEFLFRGVYLGGLRTRLPFWAANAITALVYAFAHEPLRLSSDGTISLRLVASAPLLMGSLWYGYLYHRCNNLVVTVLAHLIFNAGLLGLHLYVHGQSEV